jgi:hypothetical protein
MSFESDFLEFMPHTITVYAMSGVNAYGEETYSPTGTTYRAMVEERPQVVRSAFGEEVVASHVVYIASTERIPLTSRVVLSDGSEPPVIRSDVFYDPDGVHHVAMFFGGGAGG